MGGEAFTLDTSNKEEMTNFKRAYKKAHEANIKVFIYEGQEVLTDYAKYVLEYSDMVAKNE